MNGVGLFSGVFRIPLDSNYHVLNPCFRRFCGWRFHWDNLVRCQHICNFQTARRFEWVIEILHMFDEIACFPTLKSIYHLRLLWSVSTAKGPLQHGAIHGMDFHQIIQLIMLVLRSRICNKSTKKKLKLEMLRCPGLHCWFIDDQKKEFWRSAWWKVSPTTMTQEYLARQRNLARAAQTLSSCITNVH